MAQFQVSATDTPFNQQELLERHKNLIPLDKKKFEHIFKTQEKIDSSGEKSIPKTRRKKTFVLPSDAEVDKLLLERILICVFIKYTSY